MRMNKADRSEIDAVIADPHATVGDVATRIPAAKEAFERLGIDYCCGGSSELQAALKEKGITEEQVIEAVQKAASPQSGDVDKDWSSASVTELAEHILTTHHVFMKRELPRIDGLLAKVAAAHGERHGRMLGELATTFHRLRDEIEQHLLKEEQILFPMITATDAFMSGRGSRPVSHCGTVLNPIRQMEFEHENAGQALARMRKLTDNYRLPEDACPSFATLFEALEAMEKDLHKHIHLENNILFPSAAELEATMVGA
jgi:regulator of cell morphogenesis and NO signaling